MASRGERWAFWLEAQLDERGWARGDVAKRSRRKPGSDRPVIDASRVTEWLNKNEAPRDPAILHELARVLDVPVAVVLNKAGWLPDEEVDGRLVVMKTDTREAINADPALAGEARVVLSALYGLLVRLLPAASLDGTTVDEPTARVANSSDTKGRAAKMRRRTGIGGSGRGVTGAGQEDRVDSPGHGAGRVADGTPSRH